MGSPDLVDQASPYSLSRLRVKDGVAWVRHRWAFFLLAVFTLLVISAFIPYLVSAFYLELGGRELDQIPNPNPQSLVPNSHIPIPTSQFPHPNSPLVNPDSGHLPVAIAHLRRAIAWDSNNAQAYRLLGQAYLAQGDYLAAIEALTTYTDLRPDNPLGHLELAQVYEGLARAISPEEVYYDFIKHLPEAAVTTPDAPIGTDYCVPGDPVASCYVASTYWTMPDDEVRPVLFMHPSSWARYVLTVPVEATVLRFSVGKYPPSWDWGGDGVIFEVCIQDEAEEKRLFSTYVSNAEEDWGWHDGEVDLTPYAGQVVTLTLGAHPGLQNDPTGDWAGWAEPRLEGVNALRQRAEAEKWWAQAVAGWRTAGLTMQAFIERGEESRKAKQYEETLELYERAAMVAPDSGEPWYYMGLAYEGLERWEEALRAYEQAVALDHLDNVGQSSLHYRMGAIYQGRLEPRQIENALASYESALAADDFSTMAEAADCHYQRGYILYGQRANPAEYIAEFRRAIELNPKHRSAHLLLGITIYERDKDATTAEAELLKAVELAPQNRWVYYHLGEIYRQEERTGEAVTMYERALEIDPDFEAARKRLQALRNGD